MSGVRRSGVWSVLSGVTLALLLVACDEGESGVTLAVLAEYAGDYDGRTVVTEGRVRTFESPRHYWIEDPDLNRVAITPESAVADLVGQRVRVKGRFSASPEAGRAIAAEAVTPLEPSP
ncbi:MAG: hypothetical protein R3296_03690 [Oleiphilaceae bacterium]|nr:hypothetical protein [Oleiphilaceae bacterium]